MTLRNLLASLRAALYGGAGFAGLGLALGDATVGDFRMCNTIADETPLRPFQNLALVRTRDGLTHYIPLELFGQGPAELNRASILACPCGRNWWSTLLVAASCSMASTISSARSKSGRRNRSRGRRRRASKLRRYTAILSC